AVSVSSAFAMAVNERTAPLWVTGFRYTSSVIPLLATAAGLLIVKVSRERNSVLLSLLLLFAFTNFAQITPWLFWADKNPDPEQKIVAPHVPEKMINCFLLAADLLFLPLLFCSTVAAGG